MAKILFIQNQVFAYPGIFYISGALKQAGHKYKVVATNRDDVIIASAKEFRPDFVAFPCLTGIHKFVLRTAAILKKKVPESKILIGGIHPTLYPEIILDPHVDFICRGEGEYPTCELLDAWEAGKKVYNIPNILWKENGIVHHNELRDLIDPLDSLPFPDYSIYRDCPPIANDTSQAVYAMRGCPFSCPYCHNSKQKEIYKSKGKYVRFSSVERVLAEVRAIILGFPKINIVGLGGDCFGLRFDWLEKLLTKLHDQFKYPYYLNIRPEFITEKLTNLLKETNCYCLYVGLESGSERVRQEILERRYSDQEFIKAIGLLKKKRIKFKVYNMVGLPGETKEEMIETLNFNQKIKPDFAQVMIYQPYPGTKLADYCVSNGFLRKDFNYNEVPTSCHSDTILQKVDRNFIRNFHAFFQTMTYFPRLSSLIIKYLLKLPNNKIFRWYFKLVYAHFIMRSEDRPLISFIRLALANRKLFK